MPDLTRVVKSKPSDLAKGLHLHRYPPTAKLFFHVYPFLCLSVYTNCHLHQYLLFAPLVSSSAPPFMGKIDWKITMKKKACWLLCFCPRGRSHFASADYFLLSSLPINSGSSISSFLLLFAIEAETLKFSFFSEKKKKNQIAKTFMPTKNGSIGILTHFQMACGPRHTSFGNNCKITPQKTLSLQRPPIGVDAPHLTGSAVHWQAALRRSVQLTSCQVLCLSFN